MELDLKNIFSTYQWTRLAILIASALLFLAGISLIIYGVVLGVIDNSRDILQEKVEDPGALVYVGALHLVVGVSGTVAALLRLTTLLIFACCVAVFAIFAKFANVTVIVTQYADYSMQARVAEVQSGILNGYGGNDSVGQSITALIDSFQKKEKCCNWFSNPSHNIFTQSPWYTAVNLQSTSIANSKTLPESCCAAQVTDDCVRTFDLKQAREKGSVYKEECISLIQKQTKLSRALTSSKHTIILIIETALLALSALHIKQSGTQTS